MTERLSYLPLFRDRTFFILRSKLELTVIALASSCQRQAPQRFSRRGGGQENRRQLPYKSCYRRAATFLRSHAEREVSEMSGFFKSFAKSRSCDIR
jgi:hypothetical protein